MNLHILPSRIHRCFPINPREAFMFHFHHNIQRLSFFFLRLLARRFGRNSEEVLHTVYLDTVWNGVRRYVAAA